MFFLNQPFIRSCLIGLFTGFLVNAPQLYNHYTNPSSNPYILQAKKLHDNGLRGLFGTLKKKWSLDDGDIVNVKISLNQTVGSLLKNGIELLDDYDINVCFSNGGHLKLSSRGKAVDNDERVASPRSEDIGLHIKQEDLDSDSVGVDLGS